VEFEPLRSDKAKDDAIGSWRLILEAVSRRQGLASSSPAGAEVPAHCAASGQKARFWSVGGITFVLILRQIPNTIFFWLTFSGEGHIFAKKEESKRI